MNAISTGHQCSINVAFSTYTLSLLSADVLRGLVESPENMGIAMGSIAYHRVELRNF